jgi:hypothetical protein
MATVDEILASLEDSSGDASDGGDAGTGGDTPEPTPTETATIKAVREWGKSWEKKAKEALKQVADLEAYKTSVVEAERKATVSTVFKELELPEAQAELFLKVNEGEVTADAIKQFVTDYGLKGGEDLSGGTTESKSGGFDAGGPNDARPLGSKMYTADEALQLAQSDPEAYAAARKAGRVQLDKLPGNE